jgi:hypothetical protein
MMPRIDEVRTTLEGLHHEPAAAKTGHDRESDRGLSHAASGARDQNSFQGLTSSLPFSKSGSPATISTTLSEAAATRWLISPNRSRNMRPLG